MLRRARTYLSALLAFSLCSCGSGDKGNQGSARKGEPIARYKQLARAALAEAISAGQMGWTNDWYETLPATDEIEAVAQLEKLVIEIGEPVSVLVTFRNTGKNTYTVEETRWNRFDHDFRVADRDGKVLLNPFSRPLGTIIGPVFQEHVLRPGETFVSRKRLNKCVRFDKPGIYSVTPQRAVHLGEKGIYSNDLRRPRTVAAPIFVRDYDRGRRERDIRALVDAYHTTGPLPKGLPFHEHSDNYVSRCGIVETLAFFCDPTLTDFFLEVIERPGDDEERYALYALQGMPDRLAVLECIEARLDQGKKRRWEELLEAYVDLVVPALPSTCKARISRPKDEHPARASALRHGRQDVIRDAYKADILGLKDAAESGVVK